MMRSSRDPVYIPQVVLWGSTLALILGVGCFLAVLLNPADWGRQPLVVVGMFGLIGLSLLVRGLATLVENELRRRRSPSVRAYLGISKSGYYVTDSYMGAQLGILIPLAIGTFMTGFGLRALGL